MSRAARRGLLIGGMALLVIIAAGAWAASVALSRYSGEPRRIFIPSGATEAQVADTLRAALGKDYAAKVSRLWSLQGGSPGTAHGSYVVEPGNTALSLSRRILNGRQSPVRFTFNNIRTMPLLAERAAARLEFSESDFLAACDTVLPALGYSRPAFPAAFMPDTYEFYWTEPAASVVRRLAAERDKFWTQERLDKANALGLTPVEVATVASIIEEETAKPDEKPKVARLYLNRLRQGMRLQADPTVKFAVGDFSIRRILGQHLRTPSPYNTYLNKGLPPGPIRIPAPAGLDAVLNAPEHPYVFMCAREDFSGYHNFAVDYAEHKANARRYQAALNARGITGK